MTASLPSDTQRQRLGELARLFLRLGFTAFGGPAAHIAMYHDEVVQRRKWLDERHFMDLLSATQLIPGPNSTEMTMHIGYVRAGWRGLLISGLGFILPSTGLVLALSWLYVRYGELPETAGIMYGIGPVVIAILVQALTLLGRKILHQPLEWVVALLACLMYLLDLNPIAVLIGLGLAFAIIRMIRKPPLSTGMAVLAPWAAIGGKLTASAIPLASSAPFSLWVMFWTFLKIGAVLYGSGYVLLAFLQADFVNHLGWITSQQLMDAIAIGQLTPGPVFTSATFIGYLLGGIPAALLATVGIFLPSFIFVALSNPVIPRIRRSRRAGLLLDGINLASLGLMAGVTIDQGILALRELPGWGIFIISLLLLSRKVNTTWLILGGGLIGLGFSLFS